ncbi:MAG: hypothetical protein M3347_08610 [Armatimonadota bacterium]|nr:hypothetical protein [Armatimonadota bacterium]
MKVLAPVHFTEGSNVLLTARGADLINQAIDRAFKQKSTYKDQYCPDPKVKEYWKGALELLNKTGQVKTRMVAGLVGGTWKDGEKVGQVYKLQDLEVYLLTKQDDIDRMNSFAPDKLCPTDDTEKTLSSLAGDTTATSPTTAAPGSEQPPMTPPTTAPPATEKLEWVSYTSEKANLKMSFPANPEETTGEISGHSTYTIQTKHPSGLYRAIATVLPKTYNRAQAMQVIEGMAQSFIKNNQATIKRQSDYADGTAGKDYTLAKGPAQEVGIRYRILVIGNMLYQLLHSAAQADSANDNAKTFFDSFEVLKRE